MKYQTENAELKQGIAEAKSLLQRGLEEYERYKGLAKNLTKKLEEIINKSTKEEIGNEEEEIIRKSIEELKATDKAISEISKKTSDVVEFMKDITEKKGGGGSTSISNYINDLSWSWESYFEKINFFKNVDLFDLTNSLAAVNLTGSLVIFFCLISILSAFYGNKAIEYFDLEKRYPSLAKFISYRIKFQNYSILFNFLIISVVIVILLLSNFLVLFG